ncbi:HTH domain-containing protein [Alicyclobacillus tolerans]|uniref:helix-turn-helix transcriptional regulator n=1 Tax=Alicyclobacillus tolerans TaxID=90970 RepID=UPI001F2AF0CD|nr:HTH domain-containing protein [Alicyclobacillus tolerans]MCF8565740.1 HTH domain-containing protein [Alicyclobacillus tolerans]
MPEAQKVRLAGRLLELVDLIDRFPKKYTAEMLADHFRVSTRTIRRDVKTLLDLNIFVEYEPQGGYFIMRRMDRLPIALTETERLVLALMPPLIRKYLAEGQALALAHVYEKALEKIFRKIGLENPSTEASDFELGRVIADIHDPSPYTLLDTVTCVRIFVHSR